MSTTLQLPPEQTQRYPHPELNPYKNIWDLEPVDHLHQVTQRQMNRGSLKAEVVDHHGKMIPCYANLNLWTDQMVYEEYTRLTGEFQMPMAPQFEPHPDLWKALHPLNVSFLADPMDDWSHMGMTPHPKQKTRGDRHSPQMVMSHYGLKWNPILARDLLAPQNLRHLQRIAPEYLSLLDRAFRVYQVTQDPRWPQVVSTDPQVERIRDSYGWDREYLIPLIRRFPSLDQWAWKSLGDPHKFLTLMIEVDQYMRTARMPRTLPQSVSDQLRNNWLSRTPQELLVSFRIPPTPHEN